MEADIEEQLAVKTYLWPDKSAEAIANDSGQPLSNRMKKRLRAKENSVRSATSDRSVYEPNESSPFDWHISDPNTDWSQIEHELLFG